MCNSVTASLPWSEPWTSRVPLWLEAAAVVEVPPLVNCKTRDQLGGIRKYNSPTSCSIFNALSSTRILGPAQQSSRDEERETRTDTSPGRSPGKGLQTSALSEAGQGGSVLIKTNLLLRPQSSPPHHKVLGGDQQCRKPETCKSKVFSWISPSAKFRPILH